MDFVIKRSEAKEIRDIPGWILIYERRKVGKTFLVKNFLQYDAYFLVRRDLTIIENGRLSFNEFIAKLKDLLREDKTVVVDEFQRLLDTFLDEIVEVYPKGRLLLLGSSLRILHKIFSPKSPILGLISQYKLDLVSPADTLTSLAEYLPPEQAVEIAVYMRDPWLSRYLEIYNGDIVEFLYNVVKVNIYSIKALIGEIFAEEERELTARYEAILNLLGSGCWRVKEMAGILYNRGLLERADLSLLRQHLINLEKWD